MTEPRKSSTNLLLRICHVVTMAGLAIVLSACATLNTKPDDSQVVSYQYRPQFGFVRIEQIEPGAPDNNHPVTTSTDSLRQLLANVKLPSVIKMEGSDDALFTSEELAEIVPHLVVALAKAGPKEDVTFAVTGNHGVFKSLSPKTVTTGRLFARDGQINLIFGMIQNPYETEMHQGSATPVFIPGSRKKPVETGHTIVPGRAAQLAGKRPDWLVFNAPAVPAIATPSPSSSSTPTPAPAPVFTPALDSRYQEIEQKLRVLDRLKENKVITEAEYLERRRAILQGI